MVGQGTMVELLLQNQTYGFGDDGKMQGGVRLGTFHGDMWLGTMQGGARPVMLHGDVRLGTFHGDIRMGMIEAGHR